MCGKVFCFSLCFSEYVFTIGEYMLLVILPITTKRSDHKKREVKISRLSWKKKGMTDNNDEDEEPRVTDGRWVLYKSLVGLGCGDVKKEE